MPTCFHKKTIVRPVLTQTQRQFNYKHMHGTLSILQAFCSLIQNDGLLDKFPGIYPPIYQINEDMASLRINAMLDEEGMNDNITFHLQVSLIKHCPHLTLIR